MNKPHSTEPSPATSRSYSNRFGALAIFVGGQVIIFGLIMLVALILANNFRSIARLRSEAIDSFDRQVRMQSLLSNLQDGETGERGYVITGNSEFLEPYANALTTRTDQVEHLKTLLSSGAENREAMTRLSRAIDVEASLMKRTIGLVQNGEAAKATAIVMSGEGKKDMDAVRVIIAEVLAREAEALNNSLGAELRSSAFSRTLSYALLLVISALSVLTSVIAFKFHERRRDLSESEEAAAKYRGLLEAAPDAMVVVNSAGEIVLLNLQAEKQFGYRRDELLGQRVKNIIPRGFAERLIADGLRSADDALAQQIGTGIELAGRRKDGSEFPIEIMLSPLGSTEGVLVTAAIRDISVRRAVETHLGQMEARYRGLLEAAPDAMVVVNQGGEIILLNAQAEKQFGYRRDELLGKDVKNIIPDGFAQRLIADRLRSAAEASAQQIGGGLELTGRRKDGAEFPIELMLSPLESAEGVLVTAAIRNITVRKKAEAHLRHISEIERMQSEFVSTVSHELRTPLTSIGGSLALIAGGALGAINPRVGRLVEIANKNTQRLIRLVNDILDIEKLQSGHLVFQFAPHRIDEAIDQAISEAQSYAASFGVELRRVGDGCGAVVEADAGRLNQCLTNLISNAIKFSPSGGRVEISATRVQPGIRISVSDQGPGIPEDFRARIFDRFAQADSSDMRQKGGSGLGLSIAREIVQRHGGSISFDSVVGSGASFHLDFPMIEDTQHEKPPVTQVCLERTPGAARSAIGDLLFAKADLSGIGNLAETPQIDKPAILHVEDDGDLLEVLRETLQDEFRVVSATTLDEARKCLLAERFDLIILDLTLSDGPGNDLIPRLVDAAGHPVPIVAFTKEDSTPELAAQVEAVLTKSRVNLVMLVEAVRSAITAPRRPTRLTQEKTHEAA